jgi:hypothetical protein
MCGAYQARLVCVSLIPCTAVLKAAQSPLLRRKQYRSMVHSGVSAGASIGVISIDDISSAVPTIVVWEHQRRAIDVQATPQSQDLACFTYIWLFRMSISSSLEIEAGLSSSDSHVKSPVMINLVPPGESFLHHFAVQFCGGGWEPKNCSSVQV